MRDSILVATEKELRMYLEKMGIDILFECFAGIILSPNQINQKNLHVIPFESFKRNFKNDILEAPDEHDHNPENYIKETELGHLQIFTSRSSILDYLPEDYFAEPDNSELRKHSDGSRKSKEDIENHRNRLKELKRSAYRFFHPLEIQYNQVRVQRELQEVHLCETKDPLLLDFWSKSYLSGALWKRFKRTLHLARYIIGDKKKTSKLIEFVLQHPVKLTFGIDPETPISKTELEQHTGKEKILGFNIVTGNTVYDYLEICELKIENLNKEQLHEFQTPNSDGQKLLEEIIKHYFPLNIEVHLDFAMDLIPQNKAEVSAVPVIGYSTILGKPQ